MKIQQVLLAWIGFTDLKVARGEIPDRVGPIGQAAKSGVFSEIHLLSDHDRKVGAQYLKWLATQINVPVKLHPFRLSGPTEFGEIFEAASSAVRDVRREVGKKVLLTYHLSPGTPAMAAVWIILRDA